MPVKVRLRLTPENAEKLYKRLEEDGCSQMFEGSPFEVEAIFSPNRHLGSDNEKTAKAFGLHPSHNEDPESTHIAINKEQGFAFFVREDEGLFFITPCSRYGSSLHNCSIADQVFDFYKLNNGPRS